MESKNSKKVIETSSPTQTRKVAKNFSEDLQPGDLLALYGDLGAGKTVFIQGVAQGLNIKRRITSPTFVFVKSYPIGIGDKRATFDHLDLYRSQSTHDLELIGLGEIFSKDSIVAVEWADKIKEKLPRKRIDIWLEKINDKSRRITIERHR